jgi:hypothetical protein
MFVKGQSGNPGGRPKMPESEREEWQKLAKLAREELERRMNNPEASDNLIAKVAELATDRAYGKPIQAVEADITERRPILIDPAYEEKDEPR